MEKRLINKKVKSFCNNTSVTEYATYKVLVVSFHNDNRKSNYEG